MCPAEGERRGECRSRAASGPGWGNCSQPVGTRERKPERQQHRDQTGEDKGPGKEPATEKVGKEERPTQEKARGHCRGPVQEGPHGPGREERRDKEQGQENKGAVGVNPPYPNLHELWGCRGDCLQGSERRGEGGARAGGPGRPSPLSIRGEPRSGARPRVGPALPPSLRVLPHSLRAGWGEDKRERPSFPLPGLPAGRRTRERGTPASHSLLLEGKRSLIRDLEKPPHPGREGLSRKDHDWGGAKAMPVSLSCLFLSPSGPNAPP